MQVEVTRLYRVKAVAEMFDVSRATVYREIEAGRLPALRFGSTKGALRISGEAINAYLKKIETPFLQADGLACVVCGTDYRINHVSHVPVGHSGTGSQVFACVGACVAQASEFVSADQITHAEV